MSVLGQVVIRVNNKQIKSKKGCVLNAAGFNSTEHLGPGRSWGASYEYVAPTVQVPIAAAEDVDVLEISAIRNATLVWEGDNGIDYLLTNVSPQAPATLSDSGDINVTFRADKMERI
ncbi:phage tail tube protein [Vibrio anguillarum]|uniref:phage tail tube protein n=1 Tax=Vibrio anguillarum TaxID=55601 RepID=UPI0002D4A42E|nr:phage tail tube protein [Vibrio anguillarum]OEE50479.1 phage tail protein [Vibrio anguillarum]